MGQPSPPDSQSVSFAEKTTRLQAIGQLIKSITPLIWGVVVLVVVLPLLGQFLIHQAVLPTETRPGNTRTETVVVAPPPDLSHIDAALAEAIREAHQTAETFAQTGLNDWHQDLEPRLEGFLDWYFDYFNQKGMELRVPLIWASSAALHTVKPDQPMGQTAVAEQLTERLQREFSKRVLVPRTAQMKLENITQATVDLYLAEVSRNVALVQQRYRIPQGDWDRYLSDVATTVADTEGTLSSLSLKLVAGGGGYLLVGKPLIALSMAKLGSKISAKFAGSALAKVAAKTGGTVAAEFGSSLLDPIAGVAILIWDVYDHRQTVAEDRPLLRATLLTYLQDMEMTLLKNPETGIMSSIYQLEGGLLQSLEQHSQGEGDPRAV